MKQTLIARIVIAKRSQLKGISKKPELMATKKQINVSKGAELKFKPSRYTKFKFM